jgi:transcriptional regulator with XRE-family HTH domain
MLRLEQAELAAAVGVSEQTVRRLEKADGLIADTRVGTLRELTEVLARRGVTFAEDPDGVSVRLRRAG